MPYNDTSSTEIGTDPILSVAATLDVGPGVTKQDLHRDDFIWQQTHDEGELKTYRVGRDVSMGLLVAGEETIGKNGATLVCSLCLFCLISWSWRADVYFKFVPGSHLWDHERRPRAEEAVPAEMSVGEAFMFLGSTAHGGGENRTERSRPVHGFFYCRSYLRPEVYVAAVYGFSLR